jgi:hypothetical protein
MKNKTYLRKGRSQIKVDQSEIKFEAQAEGEAKGEDQAKVPTNEKKDSLLPGNQRRCKDQLGVKSNKAEIRGIPWCIGHRTKSMQAKAEGER